MPKMKTHRASAKRFKVTGSGKIVRRQAGRSHLNEHMSSKQKRSLDSKVVVDDSNLAKINVSLPYKKYSK